MTSLTNCTLSLPSLSLSGRNYHIFQRQVSLMFFLRREQLVAISSSTSAGRQLCFRNTAMKSETSRTLNSLHTALSFTRAVLMISGVTSSLLSQQRSIVMVSTALHWSMHSIRAVSHCRPLLARLQLTATFYRQFSSFLRWQQIFSTKYPISWLKGPSRDSEEMMEVNDCGEAKGRSTPILVSQLPLALLDLERAQSTLAWLRMVVRSVVGFNRDAKLCSTAAQNSSSFYRSTRRWCTLTANCLRGSLDISSVRASTLWFWQSLMTLYFRALTEGILLAGSFTTIPLLANLNAHSLTALETCKILPALASAAIMSVCKSGIYCIVICMPQKRKRGRPRKHPLPTEARKRAGRPKKVQPAPQSSQGHSEDNKMLNRFIKRALALHQIESKFDCMQQLEALKRYIWDSYQYGELELRSGAPDPELLEQKILAYSP